MLSTPISPEPPQVSKYGGVAKVPPRVTEEKYAFHIPEMAVITLRVSLVTSAAAQSIRSTSLRHVHESATEMSIKAICLEQASSAHCATSEEMYCPTSTTGFVARKNSVAVAGFVAMVSLECLEHQGSLDWAREGHCASPIHHSRSCFAFGLQAVKELLSVVHHHRVQVTLTLVQT